MLTILWSTFVLATKEVPSLGKSTSPVTQIAVIVAARNEEYSIGECVANLSAQILRADQKLEIIIVNDASEDRTKSVVEELLSKRKDHSHGLFLINRAQDDTPPGKAGALHKGILSTSADVIVTTDADCRAPKMWVQNITSAVEHDRVAVVAGLTMVIEGNKTLDRIQRVDWMYLQAASASLALMSQPLTAMGNNMAFRKTDYLEIGGYPELRQSVTEDYVLFEALADQNHRQAFLLAEPQLKNLTEPADDLAHMIRQRKRWTIGGLKGGLRVWTLYAMTSLAHWSSIVLLFLSLKLGLLLLVSKLVIDFMFLSVAFNRMDENSPDLVTFLGFEIWLSSYMTLLPISIILRPNISWKGRSF